MSNDNQVSYTLNVIVGKIIKHLKMFWSVKKILYKRNVERQFRMLDSQKLKRLAGTKSSKSENYKLLMDTHRLDWVMIQYTCNGVQLNYISYKAKELKPLLKGKVVKVYFDKNDLSCVYIQNPISLDLIKALATGL